jgi:predicted ATP-binding protein involved in virulence
MRLKTVHLQNYRAHADLSVEFHEHFNVVAGINGSGKTSLLQGICEVLKAAFARRFTNTNSYFSEPNCVRAGIVETNGLVRFEPKFPVLVQAEGVFLGKNCNWKVEKQNESTHFTTNESGEAFHDSEAKEVPEVLPIVVFYRATRQWNLGKVDEIKAAADKSSRLDAYKQWNDAALDAVALQTWVIAKWLERLQRSAESGVRPNEIGDDELARVNVALADVVENAKGLRYDLRQKTLLVDWKTEKEPTAFEHLSDGERVMIALVADIARRMCLLNPHLGQDVTHKTLGVVLIDELDMHLHPKWQQIVTNGLKRAFPAVQFIATSHAPQVLGELKPEEIILLYSGTTSQPQVSYGLNSSQVLEEVMDAPARSEKVQKQLDDLFACIEQNKLEAAKVLLEDISTGAPDLPELAGAKALIHRKEVLGR